jgi:hypothetical protein
MGESLIAEVEQMRKRFQREVISVLAIASSIDLPRFRVLANA